MTRIKQPKNSGCGCLGLPLAVLAFCLCSPKDIPSPKLRMLNRMIRGTIFSMPLLFVLHLCGVPIPKGLLPISFVCFFPLICLLFTKLRNFLEKFPSSAPPSDSDEIAEKAPIPLWLTSYAAILLALVVMVNISLFQAGVLISKEWFFWIFGVVICFIFTGFIRELRIHYAFAALFYTAVAGLLSITGRYEVFPFFWTLFTFCMGILLAADKHHRIKERRNATLTPGARRMILLIVGIFCLAGVLFSWRQIRINGELYSIRYAPVSEIREIVFTQPESSKEITLTQADAIAAFQKGMAESFLFRRKPNSSESDYAPWWNIKVIWNNGHSYQFSLGNGTRYYSDAVFIRFAKNANSFQSRVLYKTLQPLLWPNADAGKGAGE